MLHNPSFHAQGCCLLAGSHPESPAWIADSNHTALFIARIFAGEQEETGWGWGGLNRS